LLDGCGEDADGWPHGSKAARRDDDGRGQPVHPARIRRRQSRPSPVAVKDDIAEIRTSGADGNQHVRLVTFPSAQSAYLGCGERCVERTRSAVDTSDVPPLCTRHRPVVPDECAALLLPSPGFELSHDRLVADAGPCQLDSRNDRSQLGQLIDLGMTSAERVRAVGGWSTGCGLVHARIVIRIVMRRRCYNAACASRSRLWTAGIGS
jgi:hypothetical protein